MRAVSYSFSLFALLLLVSLGAMAQVGTDGTILGAVTDANGGLVAGATVTVTNLDTGIQKVDTTRSDGNFEITSLPAGRYSVSVTFTGFKTWTLETTVLTISERKRLSPVLEVGQVNEKVTVEATAELIQTENAATGGVIGTRAILELPLNGRDVIALTSLVPGVIYGGKTFTTSCADGNNSSVQGMGHREDQTEFKVDGVASNAVCDEGGTAIPNPDTIAEFRVQTSNFSAENGRNPIQITLVTKSGTNEFHATAWSSFAMTRWMLATPSLRANRSFDATNLVLRAAVLS